MQASKPALSLWEKAKAFSMIALLTFFLLFLFQNIQQVEVSFLFWTISTPRALLLVATLSIGVIIGYLLAQTKKSCSTN
ncbi:MAG: LapA family protein [Pseudodesulfovibrio sp.]|nr:LapA family protein [Pseudodesulfovibrio sp.]